MWGLDGRIRCRCGEGMVGIAAHLQLMTILGRGRRLLIYVLLQIIGYIGDLATFLHQAYDEVTSHKSELQQVQFKVQIVCLLWATPTSDCTRLLCV